MPAYYYERESRTPHSESYAIEDDTGNSLGRIDLHYGTSGIAQGTLCVPADMSEDDLQELIGDIDDRLVMTTDPFREDFVVNVWRGESGGVYSEDESEEFDEDEVGQDGGNGLR
jgi:hypothetical protein